MEQTDPPAKPARGRRGKERASTDRRSEAVGGAIEVLAQLGARGLTHREIDRFLGWPLGSTSNYFRRRIDIFTAIAAQIMKLDLADLAIVDADLDKPGGVSVDLLVEHLVHLFVQSMSPKQRSRSLARAEILFECARNPDVREVVEAEFGAGDALFRRVFEQFGAADPDVAARFFATVMPTTYVGLCVTTHLPDPQQLETIIRSWIAISLERPVVAPRAGKPRSIRNGDKKTSPPPG